MYPELGKLYDLTTVLFQLCILSTIETETSTIWIIFCFTEMVRRGMSEGQDRGDDDSMDLN